MKERHPIGDRESREKGSRCMSEGLRRTRVSARACAILCLISFGREATALKLPAASQAPPYNPATVIDIIARVDSIHEVALPDPLSGIHLTVTADGHTIEVFLGPTAFVKEFQDLFTKGTRLQIVGSKVRRGASDILLAREIRRQSATLYLRDKQGRPFWDKR